MKDFTLETYKTLLEEINRSYWILTVRNYLKHLVDSPFLILRHDVDRRPFRAWKMALMEAKMGIFSTFYFRRSCFQAFIIETIAQMGHEIGYHYEVMDSARGRIDVAQGIFERDLAWLRKIVKVSTVSFHGNPLTKYHNASFWHYFEPKQFGLLGDANCGIKDEEIYFASDTGRGWNSPYNVKNHSDEFLFKRLPFMESTQLLTSVISSKWWPTKLYLSIHPNRWTSNRWEWWGQWGEDWMCNSLKTLLKRGK